MSLGSIPWKLLNRFYLRTLVLSSAMAGSIWTTFYNLATMHSRNILRRSILSRSASTDLMLSSIPRGSPKKNQVHLRIPGKSHTMRNTSILREHLCNQNQHQVIESDWPSFFTHQISINLY